MPDKFISDDSTREVMLKNINDTLKERIEANKDLTPDEVKMCWLVLEVEHLAEKIKAAKNCLVCASISEPFEVVENTLNILQS